MGRPDEPWGDGAVSGLKLERRKDGLYKFRKDMVKAKEKLAKTTEKVKKKAAKGK